MNTWSQSTTWGKWSSLYHVGFSVILYNHFKKFCLMNCGFKQSFLFLDNKNNNNNSWVFGYEQKAKSIEQKEWFIYSWSRFTQYKKYLWPEWEEFPKSPSIPQQDCLCYDLTSASFCDWAWAFNCYIHNLRYPQVSWNIF